MDKYTVTTGSGLDYDSDATWQPINIRSSAFQWTASGSGTDEYYLEASGGGNPSSVLSGLVEPANVQAAGSALSSGTAGSLALSSWDWADNDTLGFSTIYVRLASGLSDPDAQSDGYVTFTDSPNANDSVYFQGSPGINGGDFTNVELDDIIFLPGWAGTVGSAPKPLKLDIADAGRVEVTANGVIYLGLTDAACSPVINRTASASNGSAGLYLVDCSALNDLQVYGGTTKLINCSVDDAYVYSGATLLADADSACTADLHNAGGSITWDGTGVNAYNQSGSTIINGSDAWAVVEAAGGTITYNSSGTITAGTAIGTGTLDLSANNLSKTLTTPKVEGTGKIVYDNATTTISNVTTGDGVIQLRAGAS